ncbi:MAG: VanZ family protein [Lachnospiraceae bacterium]
MRQIKRIKEIIKTNWKKIIFVLYLLILFKITIFRKGFGENELFSGTIYAGIYFTDYLEMILEGKWFWFIYYFAGNIVWFIPLGMFLKGAGLTGRDLGWKQIIGIGCGTSIFIEVMQFIFGVGISEMEDVILNTLGAAVGIGIMQIVEWAKNQNIGYIKLKKH